MKPILLKFTLPVLGVVDFPAYFTLLTIGLLFAVYLGWREARRAGIDEQRFLDFALWAILAGVLGARLLAVLADGHLRDFVNLCLDPRQVPALDAKVRSCTADAQCGWDYLCDLARGKCYPPRDCLAALKVWQGGLAYYGGLLLAFPVGLWYIRRHRLPFLRVADIACIVIPLGLCFGRLGCYLNGCCHGKRTAFFLGVVFPRGSLVWRAQHDAGLVHAGQPALAVHPTQLYESAFCLALFFALAAYLRPRQRFHGQLMCLSLIVYAVGRGLLETLRDDERGVLLGFLSTSQLLSAPILALGVWGLVRLRRNARQAVSPPLADGPPAPGPG